MPSKACCRAQRGPGPWPQRRSGECAASLVSDLSLRPRSLSTRGDKFTPLSARIAEMLVELRTRLAVMLQRCAELEVTMRAEQQLPRAFLESTEALLKVS
jgi:hypothetical protein